MRKSFLVLAVVFLAVWAQDEAEPEGLPFPSFYHTTLDINAEAYEISRTCSDMKMSRISMEPDIDLITFNENGSKPHKAFVLFGEHARELISPETGLHFLKELCNNPTDPTVKAIKEQYELRMILNVNPLSRAKVEGGQYCLRENENGVDLNRNYHAHWNENHDERIKHVAPGPFAFSEKETQVVRDQLVHFKPNAFFSIHSGTLGLYAPYAWTDQLATENQENTMKVLTEIHNKHCQQCKVGSCGASVGYLAPGTSMDYAFDDLHVKYAFTFEIFNQKLDLRQPVQDSFLQLEKTDKNTLINQQAAIDEILRSHSCFAETSTYTIINHTRHDMNEDDCIQFFNPYDEQQYDYYIENWSKAIMYGLTRVAELEQ